MDGYGNSLRKKTSQNGTEIRLERISVRKMVTEPNFRPPAPICGPPVDPMCSPPPACRDHLQPMSSVRHMYLRANLIYLVIFAHFYHSCAF